MSGGTIWNIYNLVSSSVTFVIVLSTGVIRAISQRYILHTNMSDMKITALTHFSPVPVIPISFYDLFCQFPVIGILRIRPNISAYRPNSNDVPAILHSWHIYRFSGNMLADMLVHVHNVYMDGIQRDGYLDVPPRVSRELSRELILIHSFHEWTNRIIGQHVSI